MNYLTRLSLFGMGDSLFILIAFLISHQLFRETGPIFNEIILVFVLLASYQVVAFHFKLYQVFWKYADLDEFLLIGKIVTLSVIFGLFAAAFFRPISIKIFLFYWLLLLFFVIAMRVSWKWYQTKSGRRDHRKIRTLIIGAGEAGTLVARELLRNKKMNLHPVAFIDDDPKLKNLHVLGVPVFGDAKQIIPLVDKLNIQHIIIAIPSIKTHQLQKIIEECAKTKVKTQILPKLEDIFSGKVITHHVRDVLPEDLLGREPVELDISLIKESITNKTVLVTGAGGSIGSEICRQIIQFSPKRLILLGHGENSIYSVEFELQNDCLKENIILSTEIADIKDPIKISCIMEKYRPDIVYHAAAHKHVPLMERHPDEAVKNNVIGTWNVAKAASDFNIETFVFISTDKAVNPTSVMGATKRLAEMIIQNLNNESQTKFAAVRFGNVLGSRGSVIPLFKKQIENGGPVTITHPEMVRYFMTIPEAARLVIQAGSLAKGGEVFVLDMGRPVKIVDLAKKLIRLSGYSTEEIPIIFTGIRPGEKLFEELLDQSEIHEKQIYPKIYVGKTTDVYMDEIERIMQSYHSLTGEELKKVLLELTNKKSKMKQLLPSTG